MLFAQLDYGALIGGGRLGIVVLKLVDKQVFFRADYKVAKQKVDI